MNICKQKAFGAAGFVAALFLSTVLVSLEASAGDCPRAQRRFRIGAYRLQTYAQTEEHIRDIRDCGIDYVLGVSSKTQADLMRTLDLFEKYGLETVVISTIQDLDPFRGKFTEANVPLSKFDGLEKIWRERGFVDRPSCTAFYAGDEMPGQDFPYFGKVIAHEKRQLPGVLPYVNLYPSYAMPNFQPGMTNFAEIAMKRIGARSYREYIDLYCRHIPLAYISYDFYLYANSDYAFLPFLYENYEIVADACRRTGRAFWFVPQVNSSRASEWISKNKLRFQAFSAMAYGCEEIQWACYTAGWFTNQVVDAQGRKTEQYEKLKSVNAEIRRLAGPYMAFRNVATAYVGFKNQPKALEKIGTDKAVESVSFAPFENVRAEDGAPLLVGEMVPRCPASCARALFVCAADDPYDHDCKRRTVLFKAETAKIRVVGPTQDIEAVRRADGTYEVPLLSNAAVLIMAK